MTHQITVVRPAAAAPVAAQERHLRHFHLCAAYPEQITNVGERFNDGRVLHRKDTDLAVAQLQQFVNEVRALCRFFFITHSYRAFLRIGADDADASRLHFVCTSGDDSIAQIGASEL